MRSEARVKTPRASRYANQLCKHFAHKIRAEWAEPEGVAEFPELGTCRLVSGPDELVLRIEAGDAAKLAKLAKIQFIVGDHLERFGARDGLAASWEADPPEEER